MTNTDLLASLKAALAQESLLLANVVEMLVEVENRRLHLELACSSMYLFCIRRLGLSEDQAYRRSAAAELAHKYPQALAALRERRIHLSGLVALKDVITADNADELLRRAAGKTEREIEDLVACIAPRPDAKSSIRKYPTRNSAVAASNVTHALAVDGSRAQAELSHHGALTLGTTEQTGTAAWTATLSGDDLSSKATSAAIPDPYGSVVTRTTMVRSPSLTPLASPSGAPPGIPAGRQMSALSESRHRVQFTASSELRDKLERARTLMRHRNIHGDLAVVVERAVDLLIMELEKRKFAATKTPKRKPSESKSSGHAGAPTTSAGAGANRGASLGDLAAKDALMPEPAKARPAAGRLAPAQRDPMAESSLLDAAGSTAMGRAATSSELHGRGRGWPTRGAPGGRKLVPAAVLREIVARDERACAFVSNDGVRCGETDLLEVDHRRPRARGGSNEPTNLRMYCRAHNHHAAEKSFGREHIRRAIENRRKEQSNRGAARSSGVVDVRQGRGPDR